MPIEEAIKSALDVYEKEKYPIKLFMKRIVDHFSENPKLNESPLPIIHSIKYRLKDPKHLEDKIKRKWEIEQINGENLFDKITDLAGVRILHLHQRQFLEIHKEIRKQIDLKEWYFSEQPKAYMWDPESEDFYRSLGLECKIKDSFYTSIHYLVQPREDSHIKCEIQVRTLFEEIWGEIDHFLNYPEQTESIACKEQIRVLAKLASTGTRLADSIFSSYDEYIRNKK